MFEINLKSRKSIFEQIVDGFKELIVSGVLKPGDKIPSVRDLSGQLTVNPNTIQKAYRQLDQEGWIYSASGLGSFVSERPRELPDEKKLEELTAQIASLAKQMEYLGLAKEEVMGRIASAIEERRGSDDRS